MNHLTIGKNLIQCKNCERIASRNKTICNHCGQSLANSTPVKFKDTNGIEIEKKAIIEFLQQIEQAGFPVPQVQVKLVDGRNWQADLVWSGLLITFELDGGVHSNGRHNRGDGFIGDVEKLNAETLAGWQVYRIVYKHIQTGYALELLRLAIIRSAKGMVQAGELTKLHTMTGKRKPMPEWAKRKTGKPKSASRKRKSVLQVG